LRYDHRDGTFALRSADIDAVRHRLQSRLMSRQQSRLDKGVSKARTRDSMQALDKLCRVVNGRPQIVADPPLVIPRSSLLPADIDSSGLDVARKVVGVGSVGTRCWITLMFGRDESDPLFLQMKEAEESVLSRFVGMSKYSNQGQRVVEGQRLMQASSDTFLGWQRLSPAPDGVTRDFYVRQLRDWKLSLDTQTMVLKGLSDYGEVCGWTLARAHARSGDRIAIAAYLGSSDAFDKAIAEIRGQQRGSERARLRRPRQCGEIEPHPRSAWRLTCRYLTGGGRAAGPGWPPRRPCAVPGTRTAAKSRLT
jgi:hypothetical protein